MLEVVIAVSLCALLLLLFLWIFLVGCARKSEAKPIKGIRFAHRGLHNTAYYEKCGEKHRPENSLSAIAAAAERGFGIEIDVRASRDGVLFVFHDGELSRMTGVKGKIEDFSADELSEICLLGTDEKIPTLSSVLGLVSGWVPLLIEIKEEGLDHTVSELLCRELSGYSGSYYIQSFNPTSLSVIKRLLPNAPRGLLFCNFLKDPKTRGIKYALLSAMLLNFMARPHFISYEKGSRGISLFLVLRIFSPWRFVYTVNSEKEAVEALLRGAEYIIFDTCEV